MSDDPQLTKAFEGAIANSLHLLSKLSQRVQALSTEEPNWSRVGDLNELNVQLHHLTRSIILRSGRH
jgi:hypothetical protein